MTKKQIIIIGIIVLIFPLFLNYFLQCPSPFVNIIGEEQAPSKWLDFWASYWGASITALISLYILSKTLDQNHEENERNRIVDGRRFSYEQKKIELNTLIQNIILYVDCFDQNKFKRIYNIWIMSKKDIESCRDTIGRMYSDFFIALERVTLLFDANEMKSNENIKWIGEDYVKLISLLNDLQALISLHSDKIQDVEDFLNHNYSRLSVKQLVSILHEQNPIGKLLSFYEDINQVKIEKKARTLIEEKRKELETIWKN